MYTLVDSNICFIQSYEVPFKGGIYVTVGRDKPLAHLNVVHRLSVDKGQVLRFGIIISYKLTMCALLIL